MLRLLVLPALLAVPWPADDGGLPGAGLSDRELSRLTKDVAAYFEAVDVDDRGEQAELLESIESDFQRALRKARADGPMLSYLADWDRLLELAKPIERDIRGMAGSGFSTHLFHEKWDDVDFVTMLSVPDDYGRSDDLHPAIVGLKPPLGETGDDLEEAVAERAEALYADLMETHIVLVPIGPAEGTGRRKTTTEVTESWMTDEGLYTFFTSLRVLLEELRFDRSQLVLDGWEGASLDATRLATSAPSFFSGLVLRGAPIADEYTLIENLFGIPVLYVGDASEAGSLERIEGPGLSRTVADDASAVPEFVKGCRKSLAPTMVRYKLGDIRFQSAHWCKAGEINRRATAKPDDPDFPSIVARIDRGRNAIEIETVNVLEMEVYLSDALLDLDEAVRIEVNGEVVHDDTVRRSLRELLENRFFNDSGDYGLYTAQVLIEDIDRNVPAR